MNAATDNTNHKDSPYLSELTDRYIFAVVRGLDPSQQGDVRDELQGSIEDAVAARVDQGEPQATTERDVLNGLGDPGVLSAQFADRPLYLIGPKYFLTWWRLLKLLLGIVVPIVSVVAAFANFITGGNLGEVIGAAISTAFTVAAHIGFWTTLVFFIMERTGAEVEEKWTVDRLPEVDSDTGGGVANLVASWIFLAIMVGLVLWDRFRGFPVPADGEGPVSVLNPDLWPWQITVLFVILGAEFIFAFALYRCRGWNRTLAIVNTMINISFAVWSLTLLIGGELFNPAFVDLGVVLTDPSSGAMSILGALVGFGILVVTVWDIVDGWRNTINPRNRPRC